MGISGKKWKGLNISVVLKNTGFFWKFFGNAPKTAVFGNKFKSLNKKKETKMKNETDT